MSLFRFSPLVGSLAVLLAATVPMASRSQEPQPPAVPPVAPAAPPVSPVAPPAYPATPSADEMKRARDAYLQAVQAMNKARDAMNAQMQKQLGARAATIRGFAVPGPGTTYLNALRSTSLPSQTVSLSLKNVSARDAVGKILSDAKLGYVLDDDFSSDSHITVSVEGVQLSTALDLVTQSAGVRWSAEKRDGKIIVHVGKKVTAGLPYSLSYYPATSGDTGRTHFSIGQDFSSFTAPTFRWKGMGVPSEKVSLDVRDTPARKILSDMLDKLNIGYEFDDDFPKNDKISVRLNGVGLSAALDRIASSVGMNWAGEKRGDKTVVRFGKTVAPSLFNYYNGKQGAEWASAITAPLAAFSGLDAPGTNSVRIERGSGDAPFIYQFRTSEERSTFTCPKCGKQTTIVQKTDAKPGDAKDKKHDTWHYCPYCGKKVAGVGAAHFQIAWQSDAADDAPLQWTLAYRQPQTIDIVPFIGDPLHFDIDLTQ